jgi:hypothetical protein
VVGAELGGVLIGTGGGSHKESGSIGSKMLSKKVEKEKDKDERERGYLNHSFEIQWSK